MRTVTYNLIQFLTEAKRGSFVVPRFQRPFIWNNAQVKLLVDSIARNFPIGSLLLLQETMPSEPFLASRPVDAVIRDADGCSVDSIGSAGFPPATYYVLDGQQRLTSLVRVFLQASDDIKYYFDLSQLLGFDSTERASASWVVKRKATRSPSVKYISSDAVIDPERCQVLVEEYFESAEETLRGNRPAQRKASAKANRIFETIRNYQIPLVIIDRGDSTEAICRIFETINSTGTRLTTFDLAVARFFPHPDLHQLWQDCKYKYPILADFSAEGERVLQIIALSVGFERKVYPEATRSALLGLSRSDIESRWDEAARGLALAHEWAENHGAVPNMIANEALLVPVGYFLSQITSTWKHAHPGFGHILEKWYFANALQQGARQASNYRIGQSAAALYKWLIDGVVPDIPKVSLDRDELLRLSKTDNRYSAIHSVMRWKGRVDLWTEDLLCYSDVEDHHIFPAALAKRDNISKKILDSIANKILVSTATNRSLGDRLPRDYMGKMLRESDKSGTLKAKFEQLGSFCFPLYDGDLHAIEESFDQKNYNEFIMNRANLILEKVSTILGDAMQKNVEENDRGDDDND